MHDMWTDAGRNNVIGAAVVFIDSSWTLRSVAMSAARHNTSHSAAQVASRIKSKTTEQYGVDLNKMARYVISDTAGKFTVELSGK